jgi:hypothetical protein
MRSLPVVLALLAIAPPASLVASPILQIQLSTKSYDISKSNLLTQLEVNIDMVTNAAPYPPQRFDKSLLITFPVLSSDVSKLYCVPQVLGDFVIWPYKVRGPLPSSLIELEVKQVSDVVRNVIESGKNGLMTLVISKRWQAASDLYEDVSDVLLVCELQKIRTTPSIFLQEFTFRDDVLESFEKIAEKRGYREGATPKEFLDLYEGAVLDGVRGWRGDAEMDQALARLFAFIDRWRGFAYWQYLTDNSQSPTFYARTFGEDKMFLSEETKRKFFKEWKTIEEQLGESEVLREVRATAAGAKAPDKKAAFDSIANYMSGSVDIASLKFLDFEKVVDDLKASHKVNRQ